MKLRYLVSALGVLLSPCRSQFDFEKEVAGFFDFGKIPEEFTNNQLNYSSSTTSTAVPHHSAKPTVFTSFSTSFSSSFPSDELSEDKFDETIDHLSGMVQLCF